MTTIPVLLHPGRHYNDAKRKYILSNMQTSHTCCGFGRNKDRKVDPCPSGASRGCEFRLRREYSEHLNHLTNFELYSSGASVRTPGCGEVEPERWKWWWSS